MAILKILLPAILALATSFFATPLVIKLARRFGLVDDPRKRAHPAHTHKGVIPRAGGLAIYLGILLPILIFFPINKVLLGIILGGLVIILVGLADDYRDLSPYFRFLTNIFAVSLAIAGGVGIPYITNPFNGIIHLDTWRISFDFFGSHSILVWADVFALVWIVWCMNMVNWSKGVDGQMPGFVAISAITIGLLSLRFSSHDISQTAVTTLAFITAFSFLGFLPWNFYPQKIMPGYGGGSLAGFLLAVLSILSWGKLGTAILVLGVPMVDGFYTLGRRIFAGRSPFWADREHLHHRLLDLGWGRRRVAIFYWGLSAFLGFVALNLSSRQKIFAFLVLGVLVSGFLLSLSLLSKLTRAKE